jgi:hypothetical protein
VKYYFQCPKCGNEEQFVKPTEERSGLGIALFVFGGIVPAALLGDYMQGRVQCARCLHLFRQPPIPKSPLASFAGWIVALALSPFLFATIFFISPEISTLLPSFSGMATLEDAIKLEPRLIAYLLISLPVLIVIPCMIAAGVSNVRFRRQFATQYEVSPSPSPKFAPKEMPRSAALDEGGESKSI